MLNERYAGRVSLRVIAEHEAAHAVMRMIRIGIGTQTTAAIDGGFSAGSEQEIDPDSHILITVAGFAWETQGKRIYLPFFTADDFEKAKDYLRANKWL